METNSENQLAGVAIKVKESDMNKKKKIDNGSYINLIQKDGEEYLQVYVKGWISPDTLGEYLKENIKTYGEALNYFASNVAQTHSFDFIKEPVLFENKYLYVLEYDDSDNITVKIFDKNTNKNIDIADYIE